MWTFLDVFVHQKITIFFTVFAIFYEFGLIRDIFFPIYVPANMAWAVFQKPFFFNRNIFDRGIGKIRIFILIELPIELPIVQPD